MAQVALRELVKYPCVLCERPQRDYGKMSNDRKPSRRRCMPTACLKQSVKSLADR